MFNHLAHAIPDWVLVPLAGIGALCVISTVVLALLLARVNQAARRRAAQEQRADVSFEAVSSRDRIVQQKQRSEPKEPARSK